MKSPKMPSADLESIIPHLIGVWRRFHKLSGPPDVLQTREFRGVVQGIQKLQKGLETVHELIGVIIFFQPICWGPIFFIIGCSITSKGLL